MDIHEYQAKALLAQYGVPVPEGAVAYTAAEAQAVAERLTGALAVKAQSEAYFRMLERQPQLKAVFGLGNHLVWIAPDGTALVIDTEEGKEKLTDAEIDSLFAAK